MRAFYGICRGARGAKCRPLARCHQRPSRCHKLAPNLRHTQIVDTTGGRFQALRGLPHFWCKPSAPQPCADASPTSNSAIRRVFDCSRGLSGGPALLKEQRKVFSLFIRFA